LATRSKCLDRADAGEKRALLDGIADELKRIIAEPAVAVSQVDCGRRPDLTK
jgi:hypothetical protein